jgi:hypothetical protein
MANQAFQVKDLGLEKLTTSIRGLKGRIIAVGILQDLAVGGELDFSLVELALTLEFGTDDGRIPERPVHRDTFTKHQADIKKRLFLAAQKVQGGMSIDRALDEVGEWYTGLLQKAILDYNEVPNAESTVKKKGFNDPLVDTEPGSGSAYVDQISHEVRKGKRSAG